MSRDEIINIAKYLREILGDEVISEIVRQDLLETYNLNIQLDGGNKEKYLRKTINYYSLPEDYIKKEK